MSAFALSESVREQALSELAKCNRCGFCLTNCPTYLATGVEWEVARGRLALIRAALEGDLQPDELPQSVWSCILCRNCLLHCPPGVKMDRVIVPLRATLAKHLRVSPVRTLIMRGVLPRRGRLAAMATIGGAAQTLGLDRLALLLPDQRARTARAYAPRLHSPGVLRRRILQQGLYDGGPSARVAVFLGCATEFGLQDVAIALGRLLRAMNIPARLVSSACCGLPAHSWGDRLGAQMSGLTLLQSLTAESGGPDGRAGWPEHVITPCASCASFLREYGELFSGTPQERAAERLAAMVSPASSFLAGEGLPELLSASGQGDFGRHTFHNPCHLTHYLGGGGPVRPLLRAIPGGGFVEMQGADACCGAGGSYVMTHPAHSDAVLDRKVSSIRASGAGLVTTSCPGCLLQLRRGIAAGGLPVMAMHLLELAAQALPVGVDGR